ncbi:DNA (cytosine-5)-methyltransferase 1 [Halovenus aranensis]|uniref:DNA (cytosine-5-)-methyltransferase n=1 Tax=Halovenus aranensis TaxID=890420 RepID=A0A1G8ST17_9EURY|nr:DNA cytosine methyltransferase [Halovenus aranensis]SDJ32379.1 DNA (cytosine-5)-methyltransferase 1 [Halovenus aranensis]
MNERPTAVSLFSGLGGLDIGAHLAGVETLVCVDNNHDAAETLRINSTAHTETPQFGVARFDWQVIEQDIRTLEPQYLCGEVEASASRTATSDPPVDLVIGGPPCQSFSRSNEGGRTGTDSDLGQLYERYETILGDFQPEGFVFENVVGILSSKGGEDIKTIKTALSAPRDAAGNQPEHSYNIVSMKLDAAEFGVPQSRERVFILGVREDIGTPPSKEDVLRTNHPEGWHAAGAALADFTVDAGVAPYQNAIRSKYAGFLPRIPEGANYQHFSDRRYEDGEYVERSEAELAEKEWDWRSRHWNYLLKLDPDRPAWTLQAQPGSTVGPFHWRSRPLAFVEQLRLMTIPCWYEVAGDSTAIQRQIGNAVPPYLGCAVVGALADALGIHREPRHLDTPERYTIAPAPEQHGINKRNTADSPWNEIAELIPQLRSHDSVELEATREAIPRLVDVLELLQFWVENVVIDRVETKAGSRPEPSQSRVYRADTPSPSRIVARISLSAPDSVGATSRRIAGQVTPD